MRKRDDNAVVFIMVESLSRENYDCVARRVWRLFEVFACPTFRLLAGCYAVCVVPLSCY